MLTRINYDDDVYSPSRHREFILNKIVEFNAAESNLFLTDALKVVLNLGAYTFFNMISLTGYLSYPLAGALLYYSVMDRSQHKEPFFKQVAELFELYEWCCKKGGSNITYDDAFLRLLDTIAPYAPNAEVLVPKDLNYSPQFKEILAQAPQYLQFLEPSKIDRIIPHYSLFSSHPSQKPSTYKPKKTPPNIANLKWGLYHFIKPDKSTEAKKSPEQQLADMVSTAVTYVSKLTSSPGK